MLQEKISACYKAAANFPDLIKRLSGINVESYTVDTATGTLLYRFSGRETVLQPGASSIRIIGPIFNEVKTIEAVKNNQQGKTDYPGFMNEIAVAGVRFYEATICGPRKRVTYIGSGGHYEELIPQ